MKVEKGLSLKKYNKKKLVILFDSQIWVLSNNKPKNLKGLDDKIKYKSYPKRLKPRRTREEMFKSGKGRLQNDKGQDFIILISLCKMLLN